MSTAHLVWPPTDDDLRRMLIDERWGYDAVAARYGVTRNVVSGRANRRGIKLGAPNGGHFARAASATASWPPTVMVMRRLVVDECLSRADIAARYGVSVDAVASRLQRLKIKAGQGRRRAKSPHEPCGCRYITGQVGGDWSYCQQPIAGNGSWCADHRAVVFQRPAPPSVGENA